MPRVRCDAEFVKRAAALKRVGLPDTEIAGALGVHPGTMSKWINHPATPAERKLAPALSQASSMMQAKLLDAIARHIDRTWQAAAWLLERTNPRHYSAPQYRPADMAPSHATDDMSETLKELFGEK